ncbi:ankyrin [Trichoderma longibrachiatum ATCC 18648]|uniref:Ankyrin n=1 Tax=Trichoderma longibrachiatum ATCC 18648 TaxID=983965 RepID=A0A2T4C4I6_TRILO|nr:ankyrin [Trichoderma longibrachiatum ATCC 18648]
MGLNSQASDGESISSDEEMDAVFIGRDDISDYNPEQLLPELPEVIGRIREWLQPTAYDIAGGEYRRHLSSHVAGTGHWLTSSDAYQEWLNSEEHGLFWIKGIPGSGKSVMAASLIDELAKSHPGSPVLFFFFRQIIDANHEPRALLRDWMDQLLSYSPPLQKQLKTYVEAHRPLESVSLEDMWKHLRLAFASLPGKVFCVADALDEIDRGHDDFLRALGDLGRWRPKTVKVLITSRPVASVEIPLRKTPCLHIRLQEALVDVDIATYVQFTLSRSSIPESVWKVIADAVPGRANGLFLYAKLAMDAFLEPGVDINAVLSRLPTDLNALYTDLLAEHSKRSGVPEDIQRLILQSVTHATRPLRLLELAEMIRISFRGDSTRDIKGTKDLIRAACGPLLEILPDETVSVIHHSFTEYLKGTTRSSESLQTGYPALHMGPAHAQLALQCVLYLQSGCLSTVALDTNEAIDYMAQIQWDFGGEQQKYERKLQDAEVQVRLQYPLFEYAASNWYLHIAKSEAAGHDQTEINAKLNELFDDGDKMKAWLQMRWPENSIGARKVTKLHIAAKSGLLSYTRELLGTFDADVADIYDRTPIWWAASEGHAEVISALLESSASPDMPDNYSGLKPLHMAASNNHAEAVTVLLEAGVDPLTEKTLEDPLVQCGNGDSSVGDSPLMYACHGHLEALEAFLPFIKDNLDLLHRALAWAVNVGASKNVALLLQQPGVDVNALVDGQTPLYRACEMVDDVQVAMLLRAGADSNIKCDVGDNAGYRWPEPAKMNCFYALCNQQGGKQYDERFQAVFPLLVQAGVDIHYRTPFGETALHAAVNSPVLLKLLLDAGLDANAADHEGATPLHYLRLASFPLMPAIELLVEQGHADINAATHDGQTPLHALIRMLEGDTLKRFLEYGADCRAADNKGNTPLHLLMQGYGARAETVKALLAGGADPNARNHDGLTPSLLCTYVDSGYMDILDAFLDFGADISAVDRNGNNLLFRLLSSSARVYGDESHRYLEHVIDRGLSPFQRNYQGETALHQAVKHHDASRTSGRNSATLISRLDFLLGFNLDVKAVDYRGNTLLHTLAMRSFNHSSYSGMHLTANWEHLLALGLDLEQRNYAGRTPLRYLCAVRTQALRSIPGRVMPIDFVLSRVKDVNVPDIDGITPLHIAVTCGRLYAKKLIDAGANPLVTTHEGLSPLHLAARCRDGNNVGLLLQSMREHGGATTTAGNTTQASNSGAAHSGKTSTASHAVRGLNAKVVDRNETITPLYYACRSGSPEIVSLLLEAGADVSIGNLFEACFEFEEEFSLWKQPHPPRDDGDEHEYRSPLKLADTYRHEVYDSGNSAIKGITSSDMARLEEIIDMLVEHGADTSLLEDDPGKYQEGLIKRAIAEHRDYTAACLKRALGKTSKGPDAKESRDALRELIDAITHREKDAAIEALKASSLINTDTKDRLVPLRLVTRFLARREYHLVEELSRLGVSFLPKSLPKSRLHRDENCTLSHLIQMGFASIVERIGSLEAERRLKTGDWHAFGDNTRPGLWYSRRDGPLPYARPFIFDAVQRESPNMDILRLLVERFAVDINEVDDSGETALFRVARGGNWWQVHQALPYLLDAGADIHVRNANGQTPLHMALQANDDNENGPFNWDAAKILIERGADVNAVNGKGQSCLAYAQHNVDMVYFLIKHGAVVNVDSIFGAIESGNISVLRALLSGGIDPNTRRDVSSEGTDGKDLYNLQLEPQEVFPLYYSAMQLVPRWHATDNAYDEFAKRAEIVRTLLQHGANPFAKFLEKDKEAMDAKDPSAAQTPSIDVPRGYEECTLLHEVLHAGAIADVFFELPNLDVNHRDARGRTLLHMICENRGGQDSGGPDHIIGSYTKNHGADLMERVTVFERLLALGADLEATDNFGRNVLHYMLLGEVDIESVSFRESMAYTLDKAPSLMNQPDGNGETPFHYAVIRAVRKNATGGAEMLLQAGADPTVVNNNGDTLLHLLGRGLAIAALRTLFETLVNRGLDINARNSRGETPLFSFYSCPKTNPNWQYLPEEDRPSGEHTRALLEKLGGDFFVRDNRGRGLLHVAAGGDVERFQELMELGLDIMSEDNAHQTAIDVAAACGNREILEIFEK